MGTLRQRATSLSPIYFKTKEKRLGALYHTYNGGRLPVVICIGQGATACNSPMLRSLLGKKKYGLGVQKTSPRFVVLVNKL